MHDIVITNVMFNVPKEERQYTYTKVTGLAVGIGHIFQNENLPIGEKNYQK